jgi:hypothetical protein
MSRSAAFAMPIDWEMGPPRRGEVRRGRGGVRRKEKAREGRRGQGGTLKSSSPSPSPPSPFFLLDIPTVTCENERCRRLYHSVCLRQWLQTLPDVKMIRKHQGENDPLGALNLFLTLTQSTSPFPPPCPPSIPPRRGLDQPDYVAGLLPFLH